MNANLKRACATVGLLVCGASANATDRVVEFSAQAVQTAPDGPVMQARMFVSKEAVRTETDAGGQPVVEVVFPKQQKRIVLFPGEKRYFEQQADPRGIAAVERKGDFNPCTGLPQTSCKKLGNEVIDGRNTEKWELLRTLNGQQQRSLHWIETERKLALREFFFDGTVSELRMIAKENVNGRGTEKWQLKVTRPDGKELQSFQWYDPELRIAIREEISGGFLRELRDIRIGRQPKELFSVPQGYTRVEPPSAVDARSQAPPVRR